MKDMIFDDFQNCVDDSLIRHKSILDILTKYTESASKVNRVVAKAVTHCGCINISAQKQSISETNPDSELDLNKYLSSHLNGELCDNCREIIEREIGNNLFYLTGLCNHLNINLYDVLINEYNKINTLGKYNLR